VVLAAASNLLLKGHCCREAVFLATAVVVVELVAPEDSIEALEERRVLAMLVAMPLQEIHLYVQFRGPAKGGLRALPPEDWAVVQLYGLTVAEVAVGPGMLTQETQGLSLDSFVAVAVVYALSVAAYIVFVPASAAFAVRNPPPASSSATA
jgi:hypothetical protein